MINAGFVSAAPNGEIWSRQFPLFVPEWDEVRFSLAWDGQDCDVLFVYDVLPKPLPAVKAAYRVFVASEPGTIKRYLPGFLSQFDLVLTTDTGTRHPNVRLSQVGLPWHVGVWEKPGQLKSRGIGWCEFETFRPVKTKQVSIVSSDKAYTQGHRERLAFVERIKTFFGDEIDVFGRGVNDFTDKMDVLSDYRYHIAIENSTFDHYWTEKLADPFLTLTYPIYHGSRNILEYFPEEALTRINILDHENAIRAIKHVIESDTAERALPYLEESRRRVLNEHNLFAILSRIAKEVAGPRSGLAPAKISSLKPEKSFRTKGLKLRNSIRKRLQQLAGLFR
ncbi:Glycosyltransferase family 10 (Fucosyltransferase) (plasmid) [Neorhizobium galegae bv. orientalis str. HAMBI 540]|uniref:Glycosyltransferase family 10 (Fucosyltransferase) n=1 Tax=Neorhizobium galegae bv. orientalis str. HAMBI 540 TaxID=1028800 RepID=A0A068SZC6_NEOGA|nr:Glycosyltransferase family 10 (Fucosyltransferase) [Neorhizobium galegae bv. orientalis str. HAMBI 540]